MGACEWSVEQKGGLRNLEECSEFRGTEKKGKRGGDKMEPIGEEQEPEPHSPRSLKYWGFLR